MYARGVGGRGTETYTASGSGDDADLDGGERGSMVSCCVTTEKMERFFGGLDGERNERPVERS